jgi:hypothetical protein
VPSKYEALSSNHHTVRECAREKETRERGRHLSVSGTIYIKIKIKLFQNVKPKSILLSDISSMYMYYYS